MNQLFYGDNLEVLQKHIGDESVDLCYVDPPFNSKRNYNQIYNNVGKDDIAQTQAFVDTWEWGDSAELYLGLFLKDPKYTRRLTDTIFGLEKILGKGAMFAYLVNMAVRFVEIWRVLKPTGSFYVHCDPTASHYLKIILDAIFCDRGGDFRNEIVWCYRGGGSPKDDFGRRHDTIFRYTKGKELIFNADEIRIPYQAEGIGRKDDAMWGKHKGTAKIYKPHPLGKIPEDWWLMNILNANDPERLGYPTQKPLILLERIIKASSNEGDVILDTFCGCGTTVDAAHALNRKWIGIDITYNSVSLILKRLKNRYGNDIEQQIQLSGMPKDLESATALAHKKDDRLRKEFEKWAILTYTDNQGKINEKKGADKGIDGVAYIVGGTALFSVKSGNVSVKDVRDLQAVMEREKAAAGVLITLQPPTKPMLQEAATSGHIDDIPGLRLPKKISKLQIVPVQDILDGAKINLPLPEAVVKSARRHKAKDENREIEFDIEFDDD